MSARLAVGDRVRHVVDPTEGVVETVDEMTALPTVAVRLEAGGVEVSAAGFWERLPAIGSLDRRAGR